MHPFFIYLTQVNLALMLFYLLYTLLLKRDTFLHLRRCFFLSAISFSLLYPLFTIPELSEVWRFRFHASKDVEATVTFGNPLMSLVTDDPTASRSFLRIQGAQILNGLYLSVTLFFVVRFFWQLISIMRIHRHSEKRMRAGIAFYQLKNDMTPFSFFKLIFIHTEKHAETEIEQILLHEFTHVRQWHSVDMMLIELLLLFSWWNPFIWLMKREMAMNLEYLADNGVLREGIDSREYQFHLLRLTYHETAVQIVNNFNVSQLKKRIMMMNKTKSPTLSLVKYLLMLPLIFLLAAANSVYATQNESGSEQTAESARNVRSEEELLSPALYGRETENIQEPPPVKKKGNEETFVVVENQPEFPGGNEALMKFLADNVQYPKEAQEKGIQGRVICNFVVMKDGSITDVNVVRGVDSLLDAEAVRVLELMPKWTPGTQRGQAVNVRFTLPVVFSLQEGVEKRPTSSETIEQLR
jgi:TonB family protein